jgi:Zn-dependent protease with chaperone function
MAAAAAVTLPPGAVSRSEPAAPRTSGPEGPGLPSTILTLTTLIPAAVGALTVAAPVAYVLHLVWPVWGWIVPFALWVAGAVLASWPNEKLQRTWYGYRDPTPEELRRLADPVRRALRRLDLAASHYRLVIIESAEPNAPATTGRTVAVTSYAAKSLPPEQAEAVLVHELSHRIGLHSVPVFCYAQLTVPIRALWWLLTRIWRPVRRMWRVAVRWHTPFGFLMTFLLAIAVAVIFVISAIPAGVALIGAALSRVSVDRTEFTTDAAVVALGLGPQLLAALETAIETGRTTTDRIGQLLAIPPLAVRRAQRLRKLLRQAGAPSRLSAREG